MQDYWLPTQFASFPFTSPPVRHRVPSHSDSALPPGVAFNKTKNGVPRDAVHRLYQGVLYIQNVVRFYSIHVNVTQFTFARKVRPYQRHFHDSHKWPTTARTALLRQISPKSDYKCGKCEQKSSAARISPKHIFFQLTVVGTHYTEFYPHRKNTQTIGRHVV